ncbi:MAG: acylaldehyde oxidase [Burkholderiales bacterium PBB6]|nr:MAG: acylaldehyde oxidase [Burkholderiales bacterium PBB6]
MSVRRRTVLWAGLAGAGALLVGWSVAPPRSRLGQASTLPPVDGEVGLNGWLKVAADGQVLLAMPWAEMGQGAHSALATLVGEELDVSPAKVRLIPAVSDSLYGNVAMLVSSLPLHPRSTESGQETTLAKGSRWMVSKVARELGLVVTGGSSTMADSWPVLRLAAATVRAQLLGAASLQWKLPLDELVIEDGVIRHASGQQAHFGELARQAAAMPASDVAPKRRELWKRIGRSQPRLDVPAKTNGTAMFGIDTRLPDMVFAAVRHAPVLGGAPQRLLNVDAVLQRPGVERVVRLGPAVGSTDAVAVVGRSSWHARQGALALDIEWQGRPAGAPLDSAAILANLQQQATQAQATGGGFNFYSLGDTAAGFTQAAQVVDAVYTAPYLAHATMEPMNCTARVADGRVDVWAPTQVPAFAKAVAARVAGVTEDKVTVHMTLLGGGFGRRLDADVVAQAVRVALETGGRPVQLLWSREEDFQHDFYRPAGVAVLRGGLTSRGGLLALSSHSAGDAITPRWMERNAPWLAGPVDTPDKTTAEGLFDLPYAVPNQSMRHVATRSGVPVGFWRSVGHSHNAFFSEGFIDELAHAAKADPVAFRLGLLGDQPRHAAVLKKAASEAGWDTPLPAGRARGVALHESFGSIVAMVMEVSVEPGADKAPPQPRVHRVVCAVDCGTVVQPDGVAQQVEGSVVFGLSAALYGGISIVKGAVQQSNFPDQPLLTMAQTPVVQVHLMPSTDAPTGMGEPAVPPVAPALANALFLLTGQRLRNLPLKLA